MKHICYQNHLVISIFEVSILQIVRIFQKFFNVFHNQVIKIKLQQTKNFNSEQNCNIVCNLMFCLFLYRLNYFITKKNLNKSDCLFLAPYHIAFNRYCRNMRYHPQLIISQKWRAISPKCVLSRQRTRIECEFSSSASVSLKLAQVRGDSDKLGQHDRPSRAASAVRSRRTELGRRFGGSLPRFAMCPYVAVPLCVSTHGRVRSTPARRLRTTFHDFHSFFTGNSTKLATISPISTCPSRLLNYFPQKPSISSENNAK